MAVRDGYVNVKVKRDEERKEKYKNQKDYSKLNLNDQVHIHDGKEWNIKGAIVGKSEHPRSYILRTDKCTVF